MSRLSSVIHSITGACHWPDAVTDGHAGVQPMMVVSSTEPLVPEIVTDPTPGIRSTIGPFAPPPSSLDPTWGDAVLVMSSLLATGASWADIRQALVGLNLPTRTAWSVMDDYVRRDTVMTGEQFMSASVEIIEAIKLDVAELNRSLASAKERGDPPEVIRAGEARLAECESTRKDYSEECIRMIRNHYDKNPGS
jgi:hypothetical protein